MEIPARSFTVFNYSLLVTKSAPDAHSNIESNSLAGVKGIFTVRTQFKDEYSVPVHYKLLSDVAEGIFNVPQKIVFNDAFPGSVHSAVLKVKCLLHLCLNLYTIKGKRLKIYSSLFPIRPQDKLLWYHTHSEKIGSHVTQIIPRHVPIDFYYTITITYCI